MNRLFIMFVTTLCVSASLGCGNGERYVPVRGTVTMDGQPLENVNLLFEPLSVGDELPAGKPSVGKTDVQGKFQLRSPLGKRDGAVAGPHRVRILSSVNKPEYSEKQINDARDRLLSQEKADGVETPSISDERVLVYLNETIPVVHEEKIPKRYNQESELTFEVPEKGTTEASFDLLSR
ncbi:MAG TPA: hypothetical protein VNQ76_19820 [Planctomicrobium sp.]|nr:hypothetical protein [Planctomicrobium sp.]